jgi:hypothetical protein
MLTTEQPLFLPRRCELAQRTQNKGKLLEASDQDLLHMVVLPAADPLRRGDDALDAPGAQVRTTST